MTPDICCYWKICHQIIDIFLLSFVSEFHVAPVVLELGGVVCCSRERPFSCPAQLRVAADWLVCEIKLFLLPVIFQLIALLPQKQRKEVRSFFEKDIMALVETRFPR